MTTSNATSLSYSQCQFENDIEDDKAIEEYYQSRCRKNEKVIVKNPYTIFIINDPISGKKFKGMAKCDPVDKFSNTGVILAKLKAENKMLRWHNKKGRKTMEFLNKLQKYISSLN